MTLLGALLLASTGAQALTPLIVRHVIDSAMTGAALADLVWWGAAYGGAATLAFAITVVATFLSVRIGWQSTNALRVDLLRHTVRLDLRFHHNHSPGEMIERVDGDITLMSNYFAEFVVQIVGNALVIIGVMAVIFSQDWRVGAVMTGFVVVSWSVLLAMRSIGVEQWQQYPAGERRAVRLPGGDPDRHGGYPHQRRPAVRDPPVLQAAATPTSSSGRTLAALPASYRSLRRTSSGLSLAAHR